MNAKFSIVQACESLSSLLSLFAIFAMGYKMKTDSKKSKMIFTNKQLSVLFVINAVLLIFYCLGVGVMSNSGFCQLQALVVQWFGLAEILWVTFMTFNMYRWIALKHSSDKILKSLDEFVIAIMVVSLVVALALLGMEYYGPSETWCWISPHHPIVRFIFYYSVELLSCATILSLVIYSSLFLKNRIDIGGENHEISHLQSSEVRVQRKLVAYVGVFIFVWFFGLLNGFVTFVNNGTPIFATSVLQALFLPLQGLLLSIFFGNLLKTLGRFTKRVGHILHIQDNSPKTDFIDEKDLVVQEVSNDSIKSYSKQTKFSSKKFSIFTTTFNLGEATVEEVKADMVDWILPSHDIYVIGFQECVDVAGTRQLIWDTIGGSEQYSMFSSEIGSGNTKLGYHGFIAITVYIRNKDLIEGNVRPTISTLGTLATGANLIVTTAQNKGGVGIPLQIYDTSIAFVVTHLPSDSKGVSKLSKRNNSAQKILRELNLGPEDIGFDAHLQHDHFVFMGDLNYRMDTSGIGGGVSALTGVSVACLVEKHSLNEDPKWLSRRYNMLRAPSDPLFPSSAERQEFLNARLAAKGAWQSVLRADELHMIMEEGDAFYGFNEPLPCFPPSYKRKKGKQSYCGDYCDPNVMIKGYSNTGEVEADIVSMAVIQKPVAKDNSESSSSKNQSNENLGDLETSLPSLEDVANISEDQDSTLETRPRSASNKLRSRRTNAVMVPLNNDAPSQSASTTKIAPVSKKDAKKIRPPSYTDRILVFSQEERRNQLHVQAYDFCDTMTVSDHRPVSMVLNLEVNSSIKFHDNTLDLNNQSSNYGEITKSLKNLVQGYKRVRENVSSALYEISILDLQVNMSAAAIDDDNDDEDIDETDIDDDDIEDVDERNKNLDIEASWGKDVLDDDKHRWSKKVEEQERERKSRKQNTIKLKTQSKNKKVKTISNVIVVCPLPTKDPLLIYKKMNDIAEAFNVDDYGAMTQYEDLVNKMISPSNSTLVTVVDNPISSGNRHEPLHDHKAFVRPSSVFPWKEVNESNRRSSGKFKEGFKDIPSQKSVNMKLYGVISSELGGNIMLKFVNAFEYDLGECVVSISHLLSTDRKTVLKSSFSKVPVTSGGQIRGEASLQIMVRRLSADVK